MKERRAVIRLWAIYLVTTSVVHIISNLVAWKSGHSGYIPQGQAIVGVMIAPLLSIAAGIGLWVAQPWGVVSCRVPLRDSVRELSRASDRSLCQRQGIERLVGHGWHDVHLGSGTGGAGADHGVFASTSRHGRFQTQVFATPSLSGFLDGGVAGLQLGGDLSRLVALAVCLAS